MKGLFLKEFYSAKSLLLWYGGLSLLFWVLSAISSVSGDFNGFLLFYPILLLGLITFSTLTQDEIDHWPVFADTLPGARRDQVTIKYLFSFLLLTLSTLLFLLVHLLISGLFCRTFSTYLLTNGLKYLMVGLLMPTVSLPLLYRFSIKTARILSVLMLAVVGSLSALLFLLPLPVPPLLLGALGLLLLFLLSWRLSIRFYQRRDL